MGLGVATIILILERNKDITLLHSQTNLVNSLGTEIINKSNKLYIKVFKESKYEKY